MQRSPLTRSITAWLALVAVSFNAFLPLLAHARPAGAGDFVEICSAEGMKRVPAGAADAGGTDSAVHKAAHCPFCISPGGAAPAPAPGAAVLTVPLLQVASLRIGATHFQSFHAREHASPRAPPSVIDR